MKTSCFFAPSWRRLILLGAFWLPFAAQAASFDCAKAKGAFEQTVCDNPRLSALDEEMARRYRTALEKMADGQAAFRAQQRAWLKRVREMAAPDLEAAYQQRIQYLDGLPSFPAADAAPEKVARGSVFATWFSAPKACCTLNIYWLSACKEEGLCDGPAQIRVFRHGEAKALQIINMPNIFSFQGNAVEILRLGDGDFDVCIQSGMHDKDVYRFDRLQSRLVFRRALDSAAGGTYYRSCEYQEQE
jgi:uncharacterized protein